MTNNNDLPATAPLAPGQITLPNVLTESDLLMSLDPSILFQQPTTLSQDNKRPASSLGMSSQLLPDSTPQVVRQVEQPHLEDDTGLELDLGEDEDIPLGHDTTIEVGRDAPAPRPAGEDLFSDGHRFDDLDLDLGEDGAPLGKMGDDNMPPHDQLDDNFQNDDIAMGGMGDDLGVAITDESTMIPGRSEFARSSQSPLSSVRSSVVRDVEESFAQEDVSAAQHQQRAKRRKLIRPDADTVLSTRQIKEQQADRSNILKPESLLPRDPVLLALMSMQKSGEFVSGVMEGKNLFGWAPELQDMLSVGSVRKAGELKRKRDSGIADMDIDEADKAPQLDVEGGDITLMADEGIAVGGDSTLNMGSDIHVPGDEEQARVEEYSDDGGMRHHDDEYEDMSSAVDTGPISLGTKHAVHILREQFGESAAADGASQSKSKSVVFQDLLPEQKTSKTDATKMFFEVLVLATKDAIKVEQNDNTIGAKLQIRSKQGLWGSWAETEAGGEIAPQEVAA